MAKQPNTPKESRNWYKDRYQRVLFELRITRGFSLLGLLIALVSVYALSQMSPLKSVEPFVIQVDPKSGITQMVNPLSAKEITGLDAVNNYFLVQYIRARESYNVADLKRNYPTVRVMSEPLNIYPQFVRENRPDNPASPAARLGSYGTRFVKFKSITYLKPQVAQARLLIEETTANAGTRQYHKIATITFAYEKLALTTEERYINPLGFRVTEYRMEEDALAK